MPSKNTNFKLKLTPDQRCKGWRKQCAAFIIGTPDNIIAKPYTYKKMREWCIENDVNFDTVEYFRCEYRFPPKNQNLTIKECPECGRSRKCNNHVVEGSDYCKYHGGNSPFANRLRNKNNKLIKIVSQLTDGRGASFGEWKDTFEEILQDKDLLRYENDIAQAELRIRMLNDRIQKEPEQSSRMWKELKKRLDAYDVRRMSTDDFKTEDAYNNLVHLVESQVNDELAWEDIHTWTGTHTKLIQAKHKHEKDMRTYISIERFNAVLELMGTIFAQALLMKDMNEKQKAEFVAIELRRLQEKELVVLAGNYSDVTND